ncbi:MAG: hypothetical protein ACLURG_11295 [Gemmiger sp.]
MVAASLRTTRFEMALQGIRRAAMSPKEFFEVCPGYRAAFSTHYYDAIRLILQVLEKAVKSSKTIQMVGAEIVRFLYDEVDKSYSLQGRRAAPCGGSFWTRNTL